MALDTMIAHDATGGGTLVALTGSSLTAKADGHLIGYFYDGISAEDIVITNPNNPKWDPAGIKLPATSDGTAVGAGDPFRWLPWKMPVRKNDALTVVATAGAHPVHAGLHMLYPGGIAFSPRQPLDGEALGVTKTTTAAGTNCAAGILQIGATRISGFLQGRTYTPTQVKANAAFTTTAFLGLRKYGGDNYTFITPIGLTDVANDMKPAMLPKGLFTVTQGDEIEVFLASYTAEQPTADVTFGYAVPR